MKSKLAVASLILSILGLILALNIRLLYYFLLAPGIFSIIGLFFLWSPLITIILSISAIIKIIKSKNSGNELEGMWMAVTAIIIFFLSVLLFLRAL